MRVAERGIEELQNYVDTLIIIPNQNLFRVANERTTFAQAFAMADDVLHSGVRGVTDLIVMPGLINRDFADIKTVMSEMGKAMMGTGEMQGEGRALKAAEAAISNPLLDDVSMKGARAVLINVTGGPDLMLFEVDEAVNRIRAEVDGDANILFGSALSEDMEGRVRVSVVATEIDAEQARQGNVQKFPGGANARHRPAVEMVEPEVAIPELEPETLTILAEEADAELSPSADEPITLGGEGTARDCRSTAALADSSRTGAGGAGTAEAASRLAGASGRRRPRRKSPDLTSANLPIPMSFARMSGRTPPH